MTQKSYRLQEIAEALGASLRGDPDILITGLATLQAAVPGQISFLANPSYAKYLKDTRASAVIVSAAAADEVPTNVLLLDNPYLGYAHLSHWFDPAPKASPGIHPTAVVDESASIPESASIGPHVVIEAGVRIGERVAVDAGGFIGARACIGDDSVLRPRVTLAHDVVVGKRCHILSGAVIGSDGFGFANEKGVWHRIAQLGAVVLGDDVEVGANTTIDRAALFETRIRRGAKIDNLVQIAHNCDIGEHAVVAAQTGLSGSTVIGKAAMVMGQVGSAGHLRVGDGAFVGTRTGLHRDVPAGSRVWGSPQMEERLWHRSSAALRRLPEVLRRVRALERKLGLRRGSDSEDDG